MLFEAKFVQIMRAEISETYSSVWKWGSMTQQWQPQAAGRSAPMLFLLLQTGLIL